MGQVAKGRAAMGWAGTGRVRMGQVGQKWVGWGRVDQERVGREKVAADSPSFNWLFLDFNWPPFLNGLR
jgi:hypothetical protein